MGRSTPALSLGSMLASVLLLCCLLLVLPIPAAASPPATPATFAASTLMAMHIALGSSADVSLTTRSARAGTLLELAPDACRSTCSSWSQIETECVRLKIVENCNEPFCTTDMMDSFLGCINCLIYNGEEHSITETRFGQLRAQITTLQNACTQYAGLISPSARLTKFEYVGANSTGSMDARVRSYAKTASSAAGGGVSRSAVGVAGAGLVLVVAGLLAT